MSPEYHWRRIWKPIRDAVGLSCRPHDMRHTLNTILQQTDQLSVATINSYFGWSGRDFRVRDMSEAYLHLEVKETKAVADLIDKLVRGTA